MSMQTLQLAGIGAGPFNLSVAALLAGSNQHNVAFFDQKPSFNWHPNLMLPGAKLQTSWMKDLVTPVDPTNAYSFLNFLVKQGRFYAFINAEQAAVSREEFAQYLTWVAEQLPSLNFNTCVQEVNFRNGLFQLHLADRVVQSQHLCLGTGTRPFIPAFAQSNLGAEVIHGGTILAKRRDFTGKRVAVIGGGQTGAELFLNLIQSTWGDCQQVQWVSRRNNFEPLDETPFINDYFTPEYVNYFLTLDKADKRRVVATQKLASDGISPSTLLDIYQTLYQQKVVRGNTDIACLLPGREVTHMTKSHQGYRLQTHHDQLHTQEAIEADIVILCTGFRSAIPSCLEPIADQLQWEDGALLAMDENYQVRWNHQSSNRIYAVNASRHHHGIVDPQTSLMAWRAATIVNDLLGDAVYPTAPAHSDHASMVQWGALDATPAFLVA